MKLIVSVVLIAIIAGIAEWFAPWWSLAIVAAVVAIAMKLSPGKAFLAGFLGIAVLWLGVVLWRDIPNNHILSERLAKLFKVPSYTLFIVVTAVLGGLIGGLAALAGALLVPRWRKKAPTGARRLNPLS
jgi:hypothetical protein